MYDKEKVDLETIQIDDVFQLLQCSEDGLDSQEAQRRLEIFGPNKLEDKEQNPILQVSRPFEYHFHFADLTIYSPSF